MRIPFSSAVAVCKIGGAGFSSKPGVGLSKGLPVGVGIVVCSGSSVDVDDLVGAIVFVGSIVLVGNITLVGDMASADAGAADTVFAFILICSSALNSRSPFSAASADTEKPVMLSAMIKYRLKHLFKSFIFLSIPKHPHGDMMCDASVKSLRPQKTD